MHAVDQMFLPYVANSHNLFVFQSAIRRRDGLQLEKERAADERERKKKVHDEVGVCVHAGACMCVYESSIS